MCKMLTHKHQQVYMGLNFLQFVTEVHFYQLNGLLGQLQCHDAFWLSFHTFPPELEFGVDWAVEDKVVLQALGVEGADWRVVAHLLRYQPEAQVLSGRTKCTDVMYKWLSKSTGV